MQTHLCESCGRSITDDLPLVPVKRTERRKSTRHAWRSRYAGPGAFCRDCAIANPGALPDDALARPLIMEFLSGDETLHHCEACGIALLLVKVARRKHVYCSTACRMKIYRDAARVEPVEHPCQWCGVMIGGRADRKYCSPRCRTAAYRNG
ncbi:hypothetical protein [Brachybacterium tyrofermentans]|uniref:hypothetical protein n=1 Tax=Brachybacterium tyrofermentans TaxID=47848 RepID=UPI003FCFBBA8